MGAAEKQDRGPVETKLRVADVWPNPEQPRKDFDPEHIADLWASIAAEGLLQPISVTPRAGPDGQKFMIVAGECRWRAHVFGGAEQIDVRVHYDLDDQTVMVLAILENARRRDVQPLEEAVAYQVCLDRGMTREELARRLGIKPGQEWRITERTCLLQLRPEYQALLRSKQLGNSQAFEMAQLTPPNQDRLFAAIRRGDCPTYEALRQVALMLRDEERVVDLFSAPDDGPTDTEKRLAKSFEARVQKAVQILRASTVDNEVVALRKVNPDRAGGLADLFREMAAECGRIEKALRSGAKEKAAND